MVCWLVEFYFLVRDSWFVVLMAVVVVVVGCLGFGGGAGSHYVAGQAWNEV